jgi:hypothetical protein
LAAKQLVDSTWEGRPPGVFHPFQFASLVFSGFFIFGTAVAGILCALLTRRGAALWLLGVEVV